MENGGNMNQHLSFSGNVPIELDGLGVRPEAVTFDMEEISARLSDISRPVWVADGPERVGVAFAEKGSLVSGGSCLTLLASAPALMPESLGEPSFAAHHGVRYPLYGGAMANGIASERMVAALGRAGFLGSFGAAGLSPARVREAIGEIRHELPNGPFAMNLIHSPLDPALEEAIVRMYLETGVNCVETAAYMDLTPHIVRFRANGLRKDGQGRISCENRVIAKVSRRETAAHFLKPAPDRILEKLAAEGLISRDQSEMARKVPMADDITVEADSGGHTDNRPLVGILPSIMALRDEICARYGYERPVRVGAAGGMATPAAVLAAFSMGAAYVVTGSVNQSCIEAGTSLHVKKLLSEADVADVAMTPAADMFEMGGKVQVLRRGSLFAQRAAKLYELYNRLEGIDAIDPAERKKLETQVFQKPLEEVWSETRRFFMERDPAALERAGNNGKRIMALIFKWYLGQASRWAAAGVKGREMDYQIWCGPAMGAFNAWAAGTCLADFNNRRVADVAMNLLCGAAYLMRLRILSASRVSLPPALFRWVPRQSNLP